MTTETFTKQDSWKGWLQVSRSARRMALVTALVASVVGIVPALRAAEPPAPAPAAAQPDGTTAVKPNTTRSEMRGFDRYLTRHPKVARALRKDPTLINDAAFVSKHRSLEKFLAKHPAASAELKENPSAFMKKQARAEKTGKVIKHGKRHEHRATKS